MLYGARGVVMPSIRIANGLLFDPWNPEAYGTEKGAYALYDWDWIGHHLANECRYAGGCKWYYSVAQHSVLTSRYVLCGYVGKVYLTERKTRLAALLHDATEAVLKDIPGPYKKTQTRFALGYNLVERDLKRWLYEQFDLGPEYLDAPQIKTIDTELLHAEQSVLFPNEPSYHYGGTIRIEPWDREYARDEFNRTLRSLIYP
jgi:uncharacterized protein